MHLGLRGFVGLSSLLLVGCASIGPPPFQDPKVAKLKEVAKVEDLQLRGLLLLLADRRLHEPYVVNSALEGSVEVREALAVALGRVGNRQGLPALLELLEDSEPTVRRAAAFALGEAGFRSSAEAVLRRVVDPDRDTGRLAVEALGKLGVSVLEVGEALADLGESEFWPRLLPSLFRYQEEGMIPLALLGLEKASEPSLRGLAVYALAREAFPGTQEDLRGLLADPDPWIRGQAARGLGKMSDRRALDWLYPLLADRESGPVIQALRAASRLVSEGVQAAPDAWRPELKRLLDDDRIGVRQATVEAASSWLLDEDLGAALVAIAGDASDPHGAAALVGLAKAEHPAASGLVASALVSKNPAVRARGTEAAALLGLWNVVARGLEDGDARVRAAVFRVCLAAAEVCVADVKQLARRGLSDPDAGVRAVVFGILETQPVLGADDLIEGLGYSATDRVPASRISGIKALVARGRVAPSEEGVVVEALLQLVRDRRRLVRRQAIHGLERLGQDTPPVGPSESDRQVDAYEDAFLRSRGAKRVQIETDRGTLELALDCPQAPMSCLSFVQLAEQGFYDGLTFHRVLPEFIAQGGDPRKDGFGGPGYTLRDEINQIRFDRGVLGLAVSSPDTAGSQFFLTLAPLPHLDGEYTALGRVVAGDEVLDRLVEGDSIVRVKLSL